MKLSELKPGMEHKDFQLHILCIDKPKVVTSKTGYEFTIVEGKVKDDTSEINLTVWDDKITELEGIQIGDEVILKNTFITSFKGELAINIGRDSQIIKVEV
jgi:ssDNA-binding replication factor A large subunit